MYPSISGMLLSILLYTSNCMMNGLDDRGYENSWSGIYIDGTGLMVVAMFI